MRDIMHEFKAGDIIVPIGSFRKHLVVDVCDRGLVVDELFHGKLSNWRFLLGRRSISYYVLVGIWDGEKEVEDD